MLNKYIGTINIFYGDIRDIIDMIWCIIVSGMDMFLPTFRFLAHLCFVLSEGTVPLQQFVEHAAEAEPVRAGVVRRALGQHLGGHVAVRAHTRVRSLLAANKILCIRGTLFWETEKYFLTIKPMKIFLNQWKYF